MVPFRHSLLQYSPLQYISSPNSTNSTNALNPPFAPVHLHFTHFFLCHPRFVILGSFVLLIKPSTPQGWASAFLLFHAFSAILTIAGVSFGCWRCGRQPQPQPASHGQPTSGQLFYSWAPPCCACFCCTRLAPPVQNAFLPTTLYNHSRDRSHPIPTSHVDVDFARICLRVDVDVVQTKSQPKSRGGERRCPESLPLPRDVGGEPHHTFVSWWLQA